MYVNSHEKKMIVFFYENEEVLPAKAAYSQLLKPEMIKEYTEKKKKKRLPVSVSY